VPVDKKSLAYSTAYGIDLRHMAFRKRRGRRMTIESSSIVAFDDVLCPRGCPDER